MLALDMVMRDQRTVAHGAVAELFAQTIWYGKLYYSGNYKDLMLGAETCPIDTTADNFIKVKKVLLEKRILLESNGTCALNLYGIFHWYADHSNFKGAKDLKALADKLVILYEKDGYKRRNLTEMDSIEEAIKASKEKTTKAKVKRKAKQSVKIDENCISVAFLRELLVETGKELEVSYTAFWTNRDFGMGKVYLDELLKNGGTAESITERIKDIFSVWHMLYTSLKDETGKLILMQPVITFQALFTFRREIEAWLSEYKERNKDMPHERKPNIVTWEEMAQQIKERDEKFAREREEWRKKNPLKIQN